MDPVFLNTFLMNYVFVPFKDHFIKLNLLKYYFRNFLDFFIIMEFYNFSLNVTLLKLHLFYGHASYFYMWKERLRLPWASPMQHEIEARLLYSGGSYCIAKAHGGQGFPPSLDSYSQDVSCLNCNDPLLSTS